MINLKKVSFPKSSTLITRSSQCGPVAGAGVRIVACYHVTNKQIEKLNVTTPSLGLLPSHDMIDIYILLKVFQKLVSE